VPGAEAMIVFQCVSSVASTLTNEKRYGESRPLAK